MRRAFGSALRPAWQALDVAARHDLVGEPHGRHGQCSVERAHGSEILLVAENDGADAHLLFVLHAADQQLVAFFAASPSGTSQ